MKKRKLSTDESFSVAEEEIENTTAKKAAALSGGSEVTVFRTFTTKDNLMFQSFDSVKSALDREVFSVLFILSKTGIAYERHCRLSFTHF